MDTGRVLAVLLAAVLAGSCASGESPATATGQTPPATAAGPTASTSGAQPTGSTPPLDQATGTPRLGPPGSTLADSPAPAVSVSPGQTMTPAPAPATPAPSLPAPAPATPAASLPAPSLPQPTPVATPGSPSPAPSPSPGPLSAIVPGSVDRTSIDVRATYDVRLTLRYDAGTINVESLMHVTNTSGGPIDRLELNTVAANLGRMRVNAATADGANVTPRIDDMTLVVPLGGVLPDGASADVLIRFDATMRTATAGSDWLFTRSGGIITLYRWLPWVSLARPFARPSFGFPFLTPVSPRVRLTITTDRQMRIATGARRTSASGLTQTFLAEDVRDLNIAASPWYRTLSATLGDRTIQVFYRTGAAGTTMRDWARRALARLEAKLGRYPYPELDVAQQPVRMFGAASPGMVWLPTGLDSSSVPFLIIHEIAHQWFFALVGDDLAAEPFAHEGTSEFMARNALGLQRRSRCATGRLDLTIYQYTSACFYEVVYVQGSSFLDSVRRRMGDSAFWRGIRAYLGAHRFGLGGIRPLLQALDDATPLDLRPMFHPRFPRYL